MWVNWSPPEQNCFHLTYDIFRCIFVKETFSILIKISLSLMLGVQLTIIHHWFRWWLGTKKATSHYLKQPWPNTLTQICGTRGRWLHISPSNVWGISLRVSSETFVNKIYYDIQWKASSQLIPSASILSLGSHSDWTTWWIESHWYQCSLSGLKLDFYE